MSNIVEVKANNLAVQDLTNMSWDDDVVEAKDIRIPRLLLMQQMSELVSTRKAQAGDIINNITEIKVGDEKDPLSIIPIHTFKTWTIQHKVNGKFEYLKQEDYTPANANRPREEVIAGVEYQNMETINLLGMQEKEINALDSLPVMLSFRMTSYACGKDILTLKTNAARINKPFSMYTVKLTPAFVKNDKGSFFVFKFAGAYPTKDFETHVNTLYTWNQTFRAGKAQVASEDTEKQAPLETEAEIVEKF
jgi:hypothetical protein